MTASLDRETQDTYTFDVISTDDDATSPSSDTASVVIHVTDENDNSPVFTADVQTRDTDEMNTAIPFVLYDILLGNPVTDIDDGVNKQVFENEYYPEYSI